MMKIKKFMKINKFKINNNQITKIKIKFNKKIQNI